MICIYLLLYSLLLLLSLGLLLLLLLLLLCTLLCCLEGKSLEFFWGRIFELNSWCALELWAASGESEVTGIIVDNTALLVGLGQRATVLNALNEDTSFTLEAGSLSTEWGKGP